MRQDGFVAEDAVEGGAADAELAGGAELVAAVEVEDILDVMLNDGVEVEGVAVHGRLERRRGFEAGGQGEIVGADGSVAGFEQSGFKHGGELAHVSRPVVLQEAGERAGRHKDRALLIARADAVKHSLGQRGDVFAAHTQRRNSKADGGEAEGEIGQQETLRGHLAQRGLRGCEQDGAASRTVLERLEKAKQKALARRGEQVNTVEISEAGERGGVSVSDQPFAGVAALKAAGGERRAAEEIAGQGLFADAVFSLDGGQMNMRRGHFSLHEQLAPCGADSDGLRGKGGLDLNEGEAGDGRLVMSGALHGSQRASPPRPKKRFQGRQSFHRREGEKHEPERQGVFPVRGRA